LEQLNITPKELNMISTNSEKKATFNMYHFTNFCKYYGLKQNQRYCYAFKTSKDSKNLYYKYSIQTIDFIVDEIKKDPENIIESIKTRVKK